MFLWLARANPSMSSSLFGLLSANFLLKQIEEPMTDLPTLFILVTFDKHRT